jgi:hypothetical protein
MNKILIILCEKTEKDIIKEGKHRLILLDESRDGVGRRKQ